MAKNPFWLRGSQGKFAGAVLQKGADGGTIIRENVKPRNPKTKGQMLTRLAFAVVNQAAAAFNSLVSHAFEGVNVGKDSRRRFVAVNVSRIKAYAQQQMNDPSLVDLAAFNPKGLSIAIPNKLIISRGSISRADPFRIAVDSDSKSETYGELIFPYDKSFTVEATDTPRTFLAKIGFKPGDELAFVYVKATADDEYASVYGDPEFGKGVRPAAFAAERIVFKGEGEFLSVDDIEIGWDDEIPIPLDQFNTVNVRGLFSYMVDAEKSSALGLITNHIEASVEGLSSTVRLTKGIVFKDPEYPNPVLAAQTIVSRYDNGVERRSNEDMVTVSKAFRDGWFGLSYNEAVQTYLTKSSYNSDLFLDQGGNNTLGDA